MMKFTASTDSRPLLGVNFKALTLSVIAAAMLGACGGGDGAASAGGSSAYEVAGDHAIGKADAPITIVEYASVTCGHCANWHDAVWPILKKDYIDTGKVRFIFREFPTPPQNLATAGFLIANCANEEKFFANIGLQFERQQELMNSARTGRAAQAYEALAKAAGLNEAEYEACLANEDERNKLQSVIEAAYDEGITMTPTFKINGVQKDVYKIEDFEKEFAAFIDVPERAASDDKEPSE